jgi:hypothetical protein
MIPNILTVTSKKHLKYLHRVFLFLLHFHEVPLILIIHNDKLIMIAIHSICVDWHSQLEFHYIRSLLNAEQLSHMVS